MYPSMMLLDEMENCILDGCDKRKSLNFLMIHLTLIMVIDKSCENWFSDFPFTHKCNSHFTRHILNCCYNATVCWKSNRLCSYKVSEFELFHLSFVCGNEITVKICWCCSFSWMEKMKFSSYDFSHEWKIQDTRKMLLDGARHSRETAIFRSRKITWKTHHPQQIKKSSSQQTNMIFPTFSYSPLSSLSPYSPTLSSSSSSSSSDFYDEKFFVVGVIKIMKCLMRFLAPMRIFH